MNSPEFESECEGHLDRFFEVKPDAVMKARCLKVLRLLRATEKPLTGAASGWAAGIIYAIATDGRIPVGIPGILNREFSDLMGTSMETVRRRAAQVRAIVMW